MRIRRIDVVGFKSFMDKTVVAFDEGVTGVVGPNLVRAVGLNGTGWLKLGINYLISLKALEAARKMGLVTVGFTGRDGGTVGLISDYHLNVPSNVTPRVQEVHIMIGHLLCELIEKRMKGL